MVAISDNQIMLKVLVDLPEEYRLIVTIMESQLREGTLTFVGMTDNSIISIRRSKMV